MCVYELTVSLKLSESQRFLNTATTEEGGLSRSSNASIRMKSNTMSKKFIHTTCRDHNKRSTTVHFIQIQPSKLTSIHTTPKHKSNLDTLDKHLTALMIILAYRNLGTEDRAVTATLVMLCSIYQQRCDEFWGISQRFSPRQTRNTAYIITWKPSGPL